MKDIIISKLEELKEYVKILKEYQKYSVRDLERDKTLRGAVERYMQISIECVLDIGEMIISLEGLKKPESYREIIEILGKEGIIPNSFAKKFSIIAGFRNILVHRYAKIDLNELHRNLKYNLGDFNKFLRYIAIYLKRK